MTSTATMPAALLPADQQHAVIAQALELIRNGATFTDIAAQTGINPRTLNAWLLAALPEQYREAQRSGVISKLVDLAENLETADSHLRVSRTRETLKFWQWVAERRLPEFAPKQEIGTPGQFAQLDNLERARRAQFVRTIADSEPIDVDYSHVPPTTGAST